MSGLQLQRQLGITRYETAWALLQKLRRAMVRPDRDPLQAEVEVDESYIGGPLLDKALVVAAVEVRGRASGRVRLQVVSNASGPALTGFVQAMSRRGPSCGRTAGRATPP
jgi:hypothetical protein